MLCGRLTLPLDASTLTKKGSSGLGCTRVGVVQKAFLSWMKALVFSEFQDRDLAPCFNKEVSCCL